MPDVVFPERRPWLIAHRAGNSAETLREAVAAGADFVECDLWRFRGRLEVRHEKTLGALPVRWDRWKIETVRAPHLDLDALLELTRGTCTLYVDLKGRDRRLPAALLDALQQHPAPVLASARRPGLLDPLAAAGIPVFPSIGGEADLQRLKRLAPGRRWAGIAVHRDLLTEALLVRLRSLAPHVLSWPINTRESADRLAALGVDGLISDSLPLIRELAEARTAGSGA